MLGNNYMFIHQKIYFTSLDDDISSRIVVVYIREYIDYVFDHHNFVSYAHKILF